MSVVVVAIGGYEEVGKNMPMKLAKISFLQQQNKKFCMPLKKVSSN